MNRKNNHVVLIFGANDSKPCRQQISKATYYGMPILEVEEAKLVIVNKRSMKPGYAGIENELFFQPKHLLPAMQKSFYSTGC